MRRRWTRVAAAMAVLTVGITGGSAMAEEGKPPLHEDVGVADAFTLTMRGGTRRAASFARHLELRRVSDGDRSDIDVVGGRPLIEFDAPVFVVPHAVEGALIAKGVAPEDAPAKAAAMIARAERTGRTRALSRLGFPDESRPIRPLPVLLPTESIPRYGFPTLDPSGPSERRLRLVGDDDAWRRYYIDNDESALSELTGDDAAQRFTPHPDGGSQLEHASFRRLLVRRSRRHVTVLPRLQRRTDQATDGLIWDAFYELRGRAGRPFPVRAATSLWGTRLPVLRDAIRLRTPARYPWNTRDESDFLPRVRRNVKVLASVPPAGERDVPIDVDWANPLGVGYEAATPTLPHVRLWLSAPVSPATVDSNAKLEVVRAYVGTPDEREISARHALWPCSIRQTIDGDVVVSLTPGDGRLQPGCVYALRLDGFVGLDATRGSGIGVTFETARPPAGPDARVVASFRRAFEPGDVLTEQFWFFEQTALFPLDRDVVAADPSRSTSETTTGWFDMGRPASMPYFVDEESGTAEIPGTIVHRGAPGTTVKVFARTAPDSGRPRAPELSFVSQFEPIENVQSLADQRWVQFRVVFTVDDGVPEGAEMPAVERIVVGVRSDR